VVVVHQERLSGGDHLARHTLVHPEAQADHLAWHAMARDHDGPTGVRLVAQQHQGPLDLHDAARLPGQVLQDRLDVRAAVDREHHLVDRVRTLQLSVECQRASVSGVRQNHPSGEREQAPDRQVDPPLRDQRLAARRLVDDHEQDCHSGRQGDPRPAACLR
jgi:hypothetical protein